MAILGQVRMILVLGISLRSLGISLYFREVICGDCQEHGIFRTFSLLFLQLFACVFPSTFFSFSFTLQRKDKTHAIDLIT